MKCPVCPSTDLVMSERQGIEIDYCPGCRGVWLDRGELDKIIEKSLAQEKPAVMPSPLPGQHGGQAQSYGHGHGHDHAHKPYRKKSFLENLFD